MHCPNINDTDYKRMASVMGANAAHAAWNANGGQPLHLNADGGESINFKTLQNAYGEAQAMSLKAVMLSKDFQMNHGVLFASNYQQEVKIGDNDNSLDIAEGHNKYELKLGDKIIGELQLSKEQNKVHVGFININKEYQNKGLAKDVYSKVAFMLDRDYKSRLVSGETRTDEIERVWTKLESQGKAHKETNEFGNYYQFDIKDNTEHLIDKQTMTYDDIHIAPTSKRDEISAIVSDILRDKEAGRTLDMLMDNIERSFPGLKVVRENAETSITKGHRNETGWNDAEGLHINLDNISYQTPVHEVAHVFVHMIERYMPEQWQSLNQDLDRIIENNEQYDNLRKRKPNLTDAQARKEYMAMIAGYVSEGTVRRALEGDIKIYSAQDATTLFARVRNLFTKLWSNITALLSGHFNSSSIKTLQMGNVGLESLFEALTSDILSGKEVMNLTQSDQQMLMSRYQDGFYEGFTPMSETETVQDNISDPVTRVRRVAELPNILMHNEDRAIMNNNSAWTDHPDAFADMAYRKVYRVEGVSGFHLNWMGKRFAFTELPENSIKNIIKGEVLDYHTQVINAFPEHMQNIVDSYSTSGSLNLDDLIIKEFQTKDGSISIRMQEIKRLVELMGGNDKVKRIMRLSDIPTEYPQYAGLVDATLVGMNPIVLIHEDIDGLDISLSDLMVGDMGMTDTMNTDNNRLLTSRFRSDYNSMLSDTKITWSNNKRDSRAAALTLSLAGINHLAAQNNIKFKVRRAGVYGMRGGMRGDLNARSIYDFKEAFDQVRSVMRMEEMSALLDNSLLASVVADDNAWNTKNMQVSHIQELYSYYTTERSDQMISDKFRDDLLGKNMSVDDHILVLRRRMRKLERDSNSREEVLNTTEYQMLSKAVISLRGHWHVNNMNLRDVDSLLMKVINPHNIGNSLVQYAATEFERSKSIVVGQAMQFNNQLTPLIKAVHDAKGIFGTSSEKIFSGMFPEMEVVVDAVYEKTANHEALKIGDKLKVKQYNTIYSHSYNGKLPSTITEAELNLGDFILKTVREQYIKWHFNDSQRINSKHTMEDTIEWFNKEYTPGTIPVLPANTNQLFKSGNWTKWIKNMLNEMANGDLRYADMTGSEFHELGVRFAHQINVGAQMKDMGIVFENGKYIAKDPEALFLQSDNLEYSMKLFQMDMEREVEFNNNVLPVYNELIAVANHVKNATKNEMINTRLYLQEYTNLLLYRKRKEDFDNAGVMNKMAPVVRTVLQLNTFLNLGFRPVIWLKSAFFNEQNSWIGSLATDLSNLGVSEDKRIFMPTTQENMEAHRLIFADFKKVWAIALKMQLVNGSERDVMQNIVNTTTDKHLAKEQLAHWGNWATDAATRSISMVSHMLHDGSYEAHVYDEQTDELSYNPKLDRRFYDEKGVEREGWGVVLKTIQQSQKAQGLLDGDKQVIGYEYEEINGRIKWYADKYLIGSMDLNQRTLLGNTFYGAAVGQFRGFSWDKIWNFWGGSITGGHMTEYGTRFVPFKDENGEWITVKDQLYMEGMVRSVWEGIRTIHSAMNGSKQSWNDMPPLRRRNLMEIFIRLTLFGMFAAVFQVFKPGDDDDKDEKKKKLSARDRQKLEFMFSDLLSYDSINGLYSQPIPAFKLVTDAWGMIIGKQRIKKMVRYSGPGNDALFLYELFSDNNQVIKVRTKRQEALDTADATRLKDRIAIDDEYIVTAPPEE